MKKRCIVCNSRHCDWESISDDIPEKAWAICEKHSEDRVKMGLTQFVAKYNLEFILEKLGLELAYGSWMRPAKKDKELVDVKGNPLLMKIFSRKK